MARGEFYIPSQEETDAFQRKLVAAGLATNGHRPAAMEPAPLPKPGKRPVDHHDRTITPALNGAVGTKPIDLPAIKREAAGIAEAQEHASSGTLFPQHFLDFIAPTLNEAELRVMLYLIRRIVGFRKEEDAISLSQFAKGIKQHDGTVLDLGTGLHHKSIIRALKSLEEKGLIMSRQQESDRPGNLTKVYRLTLEGYAL